ncbi:hypothetical protein TNIN_183331 [Trichonephila inaurata madagascariensis]|uniref:Uncharacterized protein n=1 Tax=Trichonephila inaurata madagascariensis TaxID=2747483 RepID=A0A8X6YPP4_9ARAC|nr:hypothetical protein TNIN_183331 [Trichonephila inaurata madagascariensis]
MLCSFPVPQLRFGVGAREDKGGMLKRVVRVILIGGKGCYRVLGVDKTSVDQILGTFFVNGDKECDSGCDFSEFRNFLNHCCNISGAYLREDRLYVQGFFRNHTM